MSASSKPVVLVLGATGETGQHVVSSLLNRGIGVRAVVRSVAKARSIEGDGVELFVTDLLDDFDEARLTSGVSAVISTLGTRNTIDRADIEAVEYIAIGHVIELAKGSGIAQFVLMSSIGVEHPDNFPLFSYLLQVKRKTEWFLIRSELPYTIVRVGSLVNNPPLNRVRIGRGDTIQGQITRQDAAAVLVQTLFQDGALNQVVEVVNDEHGVPIDQPSLFLPGN